MLLGNTGGGQLKSSGGDVTTVMKSLWWLTEGR